MCDCKKHKGQFLVYIKCCSASLAHSYVTKLNFGAEVSDIMQRLILIDLLIESVENHSFCISDYYSEGKLIKKCDTDVFMSPNNSLLLDSMTSDIDIESEDINCLNKEQICSIINKLKSICKNC